MITVIGNNGCSRCMAVKNILTSKGIVFEYRLFTSYSKEEQDVLVNKVKEIGETSFPIIIEDEKIKKLEEVVY